MTGPPLQNPIERALADLETQSANGLDRAGRLAQEKDPRTASRILQQQRRTGLAPDLVERRLQQLEGQASYPAGEIDEIRRTAPQLERWLAENPNRLAASRADLRRLSYLERQVRFAADQHRNGRAIVRLGELGERWAVRGRLSEAERRELARLENEMSQRPSAGDYGITGFFEGIPAAILNQLPIFANTAGQAGLGAAAGAGVGAAAGPAGVTAGAILGAKAGSAIAAARMEGGLAYLDFIRSKDESGQPLDRQTALGAAFVVGMVNGSLESLSFGVLAKTIPGLRQLTRPGIKQLLQHPTKGQLLKRSLKNVGQGMATEGFTEFMQNRSTHFWGELARLEQDGTARTLDAPELVNRLFVQGWRESLAEARVGAQAGFGFAAVGSAMAAPGDLRRSRAQQTQAQFVQALGESTKDSELVKTLPVEAQELLARMTEDGPVETFFVPLEVWNDYWSKQDVDPGEMAEAVLGDRREYDDAVANGGRDLQIPTSRYGVTLAPTDHHAFFAEEVRTGEARLSQRELREMQEEAAKAAEAEPDEATPDLAEPIKNQVRDQLAAAGYDDETAETSATIWAEFFRVQAAELGVEPGVLFERYGPRIMRSAGAPALGEQVQEQSARYIRQPAVLAEIDEQVEMTKDNLRGLGPTFAEMVDKFADQLGAPEGRTADDPEAEALLQEANWATLQQFTRLREFAAANDPAGAREFLDGIDAEERIWLTESPDDVFTELKRWLGQDELEQPAKKPAKIKPLLRGFHSKAERLVETKFPVRGTVAVARNILKDIKEEERIWIGLDRLLSDFEDAAGPAGLIEREQLLEALRASRVNLVEEATKTGEGPPSDAQLEQKARMIVNDEYDLVEINGKWYAIDPEGLLGLGRGSKFSSMDEQARALIYEMIDEGELVGYETRAEAFSEGVREQLESLQDDRDKEFDEDDLGDFEEYTLPGGENYRVFKFVLPSIRPRFEDGHFETENVVVHVRVKSRETADGRKTLFIEEIQSDWHQEGRDYGYADPAEVKKLTKEFKKLAGAVAFHAEEIALELGLRRNRKERFIGTLHNEADSPYVLTRLYTATNTIERPDYDTEVHDSREIKEPRIIAAIKAVLGDGATRYLEVAERIQQLNRGVPTAPFKKTWHELALKRMLRLATDEGFDSISWTTGAQQIARYNLRTHVSEIKIHGKIGESDFKFSTSTGQRAWTNEGEHPLSELHNLFGPELAATIRAGFEEGNYKQEYAGQGPYPVGGHGMEGFYDGMLPRFLSQFGKRYEAAPGWTTIPIEHAEAGTVEQAFKGGDAAFAEVHELHLTPALKDAARESEFALFQDPAPRVVPLPPGFHSRAERLIEEKLPVRATVQNVRDILAGAKKEELEWLGAEELLATFEEAAGPDGLLDKEFVLAHLRASRLEIVEIQGMEVADMDDEDVNERIREAARDIVREEWLIVETVPGDLEEAIEEKGSLSNAATGKFFAIRLPEGQMFGQFVPHRRNSRADFWVSDAELAEFLKDADAIEILGPHNDGFLAREEAEEYVFDIEVENSWDFYVDMVHYDQGLTENPQGDAYEVYTLPGGENYRSVLFKLPKIQPEFSTAHWGHAENVFAWVRLKDRIDAEGRRVLFVEELQSDWHQQGRNRGYSATPKPAEEKIYQLVAQITDLEDQITHGETGSDQKAELEQLRLELQTLRDESWERRWEVPNAPFKSTWREFALKRVIRMAAEGGYDAVGWTTGDQQAERWNLTTHGVAKIEWVESAATGTQPEDRVWGLTVRMKDGSAPAKLIDDSDLVDYVGADLAKKIRESTDYGEVSGDDLKVGGHGHRIFYDEILVNFANSFGKKFKAKVELGITKVTSNEIGLRNFDGRGWRQVEDGWVAGVHQMPLTPELKAAALADAFALYQSPAEIRRLRSQAREEISTALREHETFLEMMVDTAVSDDAGVTEMTADERVELAEDMRRLQQQVRFEMSLADMLEQGDVRAAYHLLALQAEFLDDFRANLPATYRWIVESMGFQQGAADVSAWTVRSGKVVLTSPTGDNEVRPDNMLNLDVPIGMQSETVKHAARKIFGVRFGEDQVESRGVGSWVGAELLEELREPEVAEKLSQEVLGPAQYEVIKSIEDPARMAEVWARTLLSVLGVAATFRDDLRYLVSRNVRPGEGPWRITTFAGMVPLGHVTFDSKERAEESLKQRGAEPLPDVFQGADESGGPRGRISFSETGVNIELLEKADLSTFLHETGHLYLEILRDLAPQSERAQRDLDVLMSYLGVDDPANIERHHHELFARSFEAYLREGKAPVPALQAAFSRIRAWLLEIYKSIISLDVNLTDEVRAVFDRMLATDQALREAEIERGLQAMFEDPAGAGMSPEQAQAYAEAVAAARAAGEEDLTRRLMDDVRRENRRQWKMRREEIRQEVAAEANDDPVQVALSVLQRGTMPDGEALPPNLRAVKLDRQAIVEMYDGDEDVLASLPRPYIYAREGGMHPDAAAELLGFSSGDALLKALPGRGSPTPAERIETLTDERMRAENPDLMIEGMAEAATEALHSDRRAELLRRELQHLASQDLATLKNLVRVVAKPILTIAEVRRSAQHAIAERRVRDVKPDSYRRAETKAGKAALEALLRGDVETAFAEKQRELLNHELFRAATEAQRRVERILAHARTFDRPGIREKLKRAGHTYLANVDQILERFEFRRVSLRALDKRVALAEFVEEIREQALDTYIPEEVLADAYRENYKNLTLDQLIGIDETLKQIYHLAGVKTRRLAAERRRNFEDAKAEIRGSIAANHEIKGERLELAPDFAARLKQRLEGIYAAHTKMEFLFEWLDGNKSLGPVWRLLFKPLADAEAAENAMLRDAVLKLDEIFSTYPRAERALWFYNKIDVPQLGTSLTKANILAIALNQGNAYNKEALIEGHARFGWTQAKVDDVLREHLTAEDVRVVQGIWDLFESYWPQIAALESDLSGLPPEKVEATPWVTAHGTFRGGYYPIDFDPELSFREQALQSKEAVQDMFGGLFARAMTKHGHTEARKGTGGKPLRLDLTPVANHVAQVVHDLTHRRAIIDVNRLVRDKEIQADIEGVVGRKMYKQIHPWLVNIARPERGNYLNPLEGMLGSARTSGTVVALGLKMTTAITQFLGYAGSIKELGPKWSARGLHDVYARRGGVLKAFEFASARSEFMRDRMSNYDRDVRDALKRLNVAGGKAGPGSVLATYAKPVTDSWFYLIGLMDMGASLPTWMGAYEKAMAGELENVDKGDEAAAIDYADQVVRLTQGTGAAKDLATIQRGPEIIRIFTMFYTYFAGAFNQFAKTQRQLSLDKDYGKYVAHLTLLWFLPALLAELIVGDPPDRDDDPADWVRWFLKVQLTYPAASVILLRDIVAGAKFHRYTPSAAFAGYEAISKAGKASAELLSGQKEGITKTDVETLVIGTSFALKLPGRQIWTTSEYLHDWLVTGEEEPANVGEGIFRSLVTGKPRKD